MMKTLIILRFSPHNQFINISPMQARREKSINYKLEKLFIIYLNFHFLPSPPHHPPTLISSPVKQWKLNSEIAEGSTKKMQ